MNQGRIRLPPNQAALESISQSLYKESLTPRRPYANEVSQLPIYFYKNTLLASIEENSVYFFFFFFF